MTGPPLHGPSSWINYVSFSSDGRTLAAASSDNHLWAFDLTTRQPLASHPHPSPVITALFTAEDQVVTLATDGVVRSWALPGPVITGARDSVFALSFTAAGTKLGVAAGSADNTLSVWDTTNPHRPQLSGPLLANSPNNAEFPGSAAVTPDGTMFVTGTVKGDIVIWDIRNPGHPAITTMIHNAADKQVEAVTTSPDGIQAAASADDGTVRIIDLTNGTLRTTLKAPQAGLLYQAAYWGAPRIPDRGSNMILVWDGDGYGTAEADLLAGVPR
jgi:WD40 repeat protein